MIILGAERSVTQDYASHKYAEDYSGDHLSNIRFNGRGKVISVVNKFKCSTDTINKNDFVANKSSWKDGEYYNGISITGKKVRFHKSETGGNSVTIESYDNGNKMKFSVLHMAEVHVKEGDIVNANTVLGLQGNTGLVLSKKARSNPTYGTHVHYQVYNSKGDTVNPRKYATGAIITSYKEQSNPVDSTRDQFVVLVPKINIRESSSVNSKDIGDVYQNEVYTILDHSSDDKYNWYKITTNDELTGWVANEKGYNWLEFHNKAVEPPKEEAKEEQPSDTSNNAEEKEEKPNYNLIFNCTKTDIYAINLNVGEKLYIVKEKE